MSATDESPPFESKLPEGRQRFLAHAIDHAFAIGRRTAEDFLRHFPPAAIMAGLEAERRAQILVVCTGVRQKIATKKSAESCAEDLQIALDEEETDAATVLTLLDPDDRVRYLDAPALWAFLTEGEPWRDESATAREHVARLIDHALAEGLLTHREMVEAVSVGALTEQLPREALGLVLAAALAQARDGAPFDEEKLLAVVPPATLAAHVPLTDLWDRVVVSKVALRHGFAGGEAAPAPEPRPKAKKAKQPAEPAREPAAEAAPAPAADLDLPIDDLLGLDE